jgi:hypothetical protein
VRWRGVERWLDTQLQDKRVELRNEVGEVDGERLACGPVGWSGGRQIPRKGRG